MDSTEGGSTPPLLGTQESVKRKKLSQFEKNVIGAAIQFLYEEPIMCPIQAKELVEESGFKISLNKRDHDHPIASAARLIAERRGVINIFTHCRKVETPVNILDYFGGLRLISLFSKMKTELKKKFKNYNKDLITLEWFRPKITPKDINTYHKMLETFPSVMPQKHHHLLAVDVYHLSPSDYCLLEVESITIVMQLYGSDLYAGVHFDTAPYYVDEYDMIRQRPGRQTEEWIAHPRKISTQFHDETFVVTEQRTMTWLRKEHVKDYYVLEAISFRNEAPYCSGYPSIDAPIIKPKTERRELGIIRIPKPSFLTKCKNYIWYFKKQAQIDRELIVDFGIVQSLISNRINTSRLGHNLTSITNAVTNSLTNSHTTIFEFAPLTRERLVRDTADYILFSSVQEDAENLKDNINTFGQHMEDIKKMKKNMTVSATENDSKTFFETLVGRLSLVATAYWAYTVNRAIVSTFFSEVLPTPVYKGLNTTYTIISNCVVQAAIQVSKLATVSLVRGYTGLDLRKPPHFWLGGLGMVASFLGFVYFYQMGGREKSQLNNMMSSCGHFCSRLISRVKNFFKKSPPKTKEDKLSTPIFTECTTVDDRRENMEFESFLDKYLELEHMEEDFGDGEIVLSVDDAYLPSIPHFSDRERYSDRMNKLEHPGIFILIATQAVMARPIGDGYFNLAYELRNRLVLPESNPLHTCEKLCKRSNSIKQCDLKQQWMSLTKYVISMTRVEKQTHYGKAEFDKVLNTETWIKHFGSANKKQRARRAVENKMNNDFNNGVKCFMKSDEVLFPKNIEGRRQLKPRVIQNVSSDLQALCATQIDLFIMLCKTRLFNRDIVYSLDDIDFTITIGSGSDNEMLDSWYTECYTQLNDMRSIKATKPFLHCIVAGDDFGGLFWNGKELIAIENDFSSFDRTEGVHAMESEYSFLQSFGFNIQLINYMRSSTWSTPKYTTKDGKTVSMPAPVQRFSGGPDTTLGNCLINIFSIFHCCGKFDGNNFELANKQLELGLIAKETHGTVEMNGVCGLTFLKGWWCPDTQGNFHWVPLPSQLIKLGKVGTNPATILPNVVKQHGLVAAYQAVARATALGFGKVPMNYPLLGIFLNKYINLSAEDVDPIVRHQYKIQMTDSDFSIDRDIAIEWIQSRYDLSPEEVLSMEEAIEQASFPTILLGPLWVKLTRRDYG